MKNPDPPKNQGEGDYDAARRYTKRTKDFIDSGKVDEAAKEAAPHSKAEAEELKAAEQSGLAHAKGARKPAADDSKKTSTPKS